MCFYISDGVSVDICRKEQGWSKIPADEKLHIFSSTQSKQVANSNTHCSCRVAAAANNSSSDGNASADLFAAVDVSIKVSVFGFEQSRNDPRRCWASLSTSSSSVPNKTDMLLCLSANLINKDLVTYTLIGSEAFVVIEFRREELPSEDPGASLFLSILG